jgi:TPR repeat protein
MEYVLKILISLILIIVLFPLNFVAANSEKSSKEIIEAAKSGDAESQATLGSTLISIEKYPEAIEWLTKAAEQDHVDSQLILSAMFAKGLGTNKDEKMAVYWLEKAAIAGSPQAQSQLGLSYSMGKGVEQDYKEAYKWLLKSAEQDYAKAQKLIGYMYFRGDGVNQDFDKAAAWMRKAANKGDLDSQEFLGMLSVMGEGNFVDYVEGYKWLNIAANQGSPEAIKNRAEIIEKMSPTQIKEGQKLSRNWKPEK